MYYVIRCEFIPISSTGKDSEVITEFLVTVLINL
jgi:hypothetical protein